MNSRKAVAAALMASVCLFGATATLSAAGTSANNGNKTPKPPTIHNWSAKPGDHPKLDRTLNDRAAAGGSGKSRVIVEIVPGADVSADAAKNGAKRGLKFGLINGELMEVPNGQLRKLADSPAVKAMHWDRPTGGELNRAAVVEGARAVQEVYGYDGAGVGVAVIDSGITSWHDDLTYAGINPNVKVVGGQRVTKFLDFVNGRTTPYDDNGHGSHVAGIIAGNGYDTQGARAGFAPAADIVSLKVLDQNGAGSISNVIAALDWVYTNAATYNVRVVNLSVGASVSESYWTDPLTQAAKRLVDKGITVVTAAGNLGKNPATGAQQYGAITSPGNAPWVLTVGAYSHQGTITRTDDIMAPYSSRGPTAIDFAAKPDVVATGTGIVSLAVQGSTFYQTKQAYLLSGSPSVKTAYKPYLSLTGTSMAAPMVTGTVALMLQANPKLTPNLIKGIIEYTAQVYNYDALTEGAGFLNTKGAVDLAKYLYAPKAGTKYPTNKAWSKQMIWGNHRLANGVIKPAGSAWALSSVWGAAVDLDGDNIVWGTNCGTLDKGCDNVVWGTFADLDADNIVWGTVDVDGDNIVWGTVDGDSDNIVWGTSCGVNQSCTNVVWGSECGGVDCDNIVWGTSVSDLDLDNIVWGTQINADAIVWGTGGSVKNGVWGTSSESDDVTWGCSGEETPPFDDPDVPSVFDGTVFDSLFGLTVTSTPTTLLGMWISPPPAIRPETYIATEEV